MNYEGQTIEMNIKSLLLCPDAQTSIKAVRANVQRRMGPLWLLSFRLRSDYYSRALRTTLWEPFQSANAQRRSPNKSFKEGTRLATIILHSNHRD